VWNYCLILRFLRFFAAIPDFCTSLKWAPICEIADSQAGGLVIMKVWAEAGAVVILLIIAAVCRLRWKEGGSLGRLPRRRWAREPSENCASARRAVHYKNSC
jgi:hypothetical protein